MSINRTVKTLTKITKKYAPEILGIVGSAGVILTAYVTKKQTEQIISKKAIYTKEEYTNLPVSKKIETTGVNYAAIIACGTMTIASIMSSCVLGRKQINAAISAYIFAQHKYSQFKLKAQEVVGKEKVEEIENDIDNENLIHISKIESHYYKDEFDDLLDDEILIYEPYTETLTVGTANALPLLELEINREFHPMDLTSGCWTLTLSDVFDLMNVEPNNRPLANMIGWNLYQLNTAYESDWLGVDLVETNQNIFGKPVYKLIFDIDPSYSGLRMD